MDNEYKKYRESRFYDYFNKLTNEIDTLRDLDVSFFFFQTPVASRIKNLSDFEIDRINNWVFDFNSIDKNDFENLKRIYAEDFDSEYLKSLYEGANVYKKEGIRYLADYESKYVNVINGKRLTYFQPKKYKNHIYIYGQCTARGTGVEDSNTIASYLQRFINEEYPDTYKVINAAIGCGSDIGDDIEHIKNTSYLSGDIVILCTNLEIVPVSIIKEKVDNYYDTSRLFDRPHTYGEWFTDMTFHTNMIGNKIIADYIFDILRDKEEFKKSNNILVQDKSETTKSIYVDSEEIREYVENTYAKWKKKSGLTGAIVMNCNPFTLGHLYLIETASKQVDNLYIFVVEENKSYFSFEERFELVKKGTEHLNNVQIVPSGEYIISAATFPGYFYKDGNTEIYVDTSKDVHIFGKYIAPVLGITKRFVGNEPNDYVTRTYNETMKDILPLYDIEVIEIMRKEDAGQVISASLVRKLLEKKDFLAIEKIVPEATLRYLVEKYG